MRFFALLIFLALSGRALAQYPDYRLFQQPNLRLAQPYFAFAPPSGAGLPVAQTLCSRFTAAQLDGGWCFNGDATMATGSSIILADAGTTGFGVVTICPDGPSCAERVSTLFTSDGGVAAGQGGFVSPAVAKPAGAFTVGCLLSIATWANNFETISYGTGAAGFVLEGIGGISGRVDVYFEGILKRSITGLLPGAVHQLALTMNAAQTSARAYVDGAAATTAFAPGFSSTNKSWAVGATPTGTWPLSGGSRVHGCFMVQEELSAATIEAQARAVLATAPTSARGVALACTRTSASSCPQPYDTEASVTDLPANRCCIAGGPANTGALTRYRGYTQLALRSSEFDNAAWVKESSGVDVPVVTSNAALSPNGTLTADRVQIPSTPAGYSILRQSSACPATGSATASVWVKGNGTSGTIGLQTVLPVACVACAYTATAWTRCRFTTTMTSVGNLHIGNDPADGCAFATTAAQDVFLWRANCTATDRLMPGVEATSATVIVQPTAAQFAKQNLSQLEVAGCVAATYSPIGAAATGVADGIVFQNPNGRLLYRDTTANIKAYDGVNTPAHALTWAAGTPVRVANRWTGATTTLWNLTAGTSTAGVYDGTWGFGASSTLDVGYTATLTTPEGWLYDVQLDPSPARCR